MKLYLLFTYVLLGLVTSSYAQSESTPAANNAFKNNLLKDDLQKKYFGQGTVTFNCDSLLDSLLIQEKTVNLQQGTKGYRVQLYKSNTTGSLARKEAYAISSRYRAKYPNGDRCYTFFKRPFWVVQVGNFREHHCALKAKSQLEKAFSDIKDNISVVPNTVIDTK